MGQSKYAAQEAWKKRNPDKDRQYRREVARKLRVTVLELYGNCCKTCNFSDARALELDHPNGGGYEERKRLSNQGVYRRALKFPLEYQLLCANCNRIKKAVQQENRVKVSGPRKSGLVA